MNNNRSTLRCSLLEAVNETRNDEELAEFIVNSDLLNIIISKATCTEPELRERLRYGTSDAVRAALSKARAGKANFPLPVLEGRRWSKAAVENYRNATQRN